MAATTSKTTTDHDEIREWVEAHKGCPARVKATARKNDPGILRIDYTGYSGQDTLETIPWEDWFKAFDEDGLAFVYSTKRGSRFSKLVARSAGGQKTAGRKGTAGKKAASKKGASGTKTAAKKGAAKKSGASKTGATNRAASKKTSARKGAAKKAAAKKGAAKKAGAKKKAASRTKRAGGR